MTLSHLRDILAAFLALRRERRPEFLGPLLVLVRDVSQEGPRVAQQVLGGRMDLGECLPLIWIEPRRCSVNDFIRSAKSAMIPRLLLKMVSHPRARFDREAPMPPAARLGGSLSHRSEGLDALETNPGPRADTPTLLA